MITRDDVRSETFAERRRYINQLVELLAMEVATACPGSHRLVQHRDRKPPWCEDCRRTIRGEHVR